MSSRTIAITNNKGGVGKTTTAVNLAHGLALQRQRVLLIDLDSQGSAALHLGLRPGPGTYRLLLAGDPLGALVEDARPGLQLLPSDETLADVRDLLAMRAARGQPAVDMLAQALEGETAVYDFVIIDGAPSMDLLQLGALRAADEAMIPVSVDFLSAAGTAQQVKALEELDGARLAYVVPTRFDGRLNRARAMLGLLQEQFGRLVTAPIRENTRLAEAAHYGLTIFEHDPGAMGAEDYARLTMEVLKHG